MLQVTPHGRADGQFNAKRRWCDRHIAEGKYYGCVYEPDALIEPAPIVCCL